MRIGNFGPFKFARLGSSALAELTTGLDRLTKGKLWLKILVALVLGIAFGISLSPDLNLIAQSWTNTIVAWVSFPGQLFLALIRLVVIPLVFASVVLGIISSESVQQLKSLGARIGFYYVFTTIIAVGLGFGVAFLLKPGQWIDHTLLKTNPANTPEAIKEAGAQGFSFSSELLTGIIPSNPFSAFIGGEMLQVVVLAIFLGIALMSLKKDEALPLVALLNTLQKTSMVVIGWAMWLAPVAVFGMTSRLFAQLGFKAILGLGFYVATVLLGLALLMTFYLILVRAIAKKSPWEFLRQVREVQLLAFSTSSSASVMPLSIETAQSKLGVRPSVAQFVVPLGTTVNMDGTALYQGVATVFLAQVFQTDLSMGQLGLVVVTATLSSIGAPGTPGVGMAVLASILASVGIPAHGIMLLMGVDRILDMSRTVLNVTGDLTASLVMNRLTDSGGNELSSDSDNADADTLDASIA